MSEQLQVGQIIELTDGRLATIRYIGQPHFAAGDWVGVELEDESGKNDGSVQGERYFDCGMGRGMFVRPTTVTIIEQAPPPKPAAVPAKKAARPSSIVSSGIGRRMSAVPDVGAGKRMSINSASPTPSSRSRPSSLLRVRPLRHS
jgi:dynactin 1